MLLLLALSCSSTATVVNWCDEAPGNCEPCVSDGDCGYGGNPCLDTVYCAEDGSGPAVPEIGCSAALEHPWPDEATCRCDEGVCRSGLDG